MKLVKFSLINLFFLVSFFYFSQTAQAGIVPCGLDSEYANRCTLCHLFTGIENIVDWGMKILVVVALVAIVAGAIMYIISAGNSGMMESAKNVIKQALWGVVIVLGAWLIVNTVMFLIATKADLGVGITSWNDFNCEGSTQGAVAVTGMAPTNGACPSGYHLTTARTWCLADSAVVTPTTCTSFTYTWSPDPCTVGSTQTATVVSRSPSGCTGGNPQTTRSCPAATTTCTSFTYSDWTLCTSATTTQTRIITGRFPAGCVDGTPGELTKSCSTTAAKLPEACKPYESAFETASGGNKNLKCLLVGIAMGESSCDSSKTNGGGCGLMQIENGDCDYLIDHPEEGIAQAAQMINTNKAALEAYAQTFDIGSNIEASGETVTYGSSTYDKGNDDLIASYNGGTGNRNDNGSGKKDPFAISTDCPTPPTPAWQCHINAGEFGTATQPYVQNVQRYQSECLGN